MKRCDINSKSCYLLCKIAIIPINYSLKTTKSSQENYLIASAVSICAKVTFAKTSSVIFFVENAMNSEYSSHVFLQSYACCHISECTNERPVDDSTLMTTAYGFKI